MADGPRFTPPRGGKGSMRTPVRRAAAHGLRRVSRHRPDRFTSTVPAPAAGGGLTGNQRESGR